MIVAASMGGSYALPFVMDPGPYKITGYVTAAALRSRHNAKPPSVPVLGIYGSEDQPRLDSDRRACFAVPPSPYGCYGNRTQLIVLANAPHPCYLRDAAAARASSRNSSSRSRAVRWRAPRPWRLPVTADPPPWRRRCSTGLSERSAAAERPSSARCQSRPRCIVACHLRGRTATTPTRAAGAPRHRRDVAG